MVEIDGLLFDGKKVNKIPVVLSVDNEGVAQLSLSSDNSFKFSRLAISPRIANSTRFLTLPDGRLFESEENQKIDNLIELYSVSRHSQIHSNAWFIRLAIMAVILLSSWGLISYGIPALTYKVAMKVPDEMLIEYGQRALLDIDKKHFSKSTIPEKRQREIRSSFKKIIPDSEQKLAYKLHFRASEKIGANAFALPSGDIVITDELINLSKHNDEILSILLHEIAHVELRHAVQGVIRTSSIVLFVVAVTGDIASLGTVLVGIPAMLLDSSYSRQMEWQSDSYSLEKMQVYGIDPVVFANILSEIRLSHQRKKRKVKQNSGELSEQKNSTVLNDVNPGDVNPNDQKTKEKKPGINNEGASYWSSHPPSEERIERFRKASVSFNSSMK